MNPPLTNNQPSYQDIVMPLHLAQRMIEQRGHSWHLESDCLVVINRGYYLGFAAIKDDGVRYLDLTRLDK
jgi:hypothetical protein